MGQRVQRIQYLEKQIVSHVRGAESYLARAIKTWRRHIPLLGHIEQWQAPKRPFNTLHHVHCRRVQRENVSECAKNGDSTFHYEPHIPLVGIVHFNVTHTNKESPLRVLRTVTDIYILVCLVSAIFPTVHSSAGSASSRSFYVATNEKPIWRICSRLFGTYGPDSLPDDCERSVNSRSQIKSSLVKLNFSQYLQCFFIPNYFLITFVHLFFVCKALPHESDNYQLGFANDVLIAAENCPSIPCRFGRPENVLCLWNQ